MLSAFRVACRLSAQCKPLTAEKKIDEKKIRLDLLAFPKGLRRLSLSKDCGRVEQLLALAQSCPGMTWLELCGVHVRAQPLFDLCQLFTRLQVLDICDQPPAAKGHAFDHTQSIRLLLDRGLRELSYTARPKDGVLDHLRAAAPVSLGHFKLAVLEVHVYSGVQVDLSLPLELETLAVALRGGTVKRTDVNATHVVVTVAHKSKTLVKSLGALWSGVCSVRNVRVKFEPKIQGASVHFCDSLSVATFDSVTGLRCDSMPVGDITALIAACTRNQKNSRLQTVRVHRTANIDLCAAVSHALILATRFEVVQFVHEQGVCGDDACAH